MRPRLTAAVLCGAMFAATGVARADGGPIMPLDQVQAGMDCTGETVVQGTSISTFDVHVMGVVQQSDQGPAGPRILVSVSGPAVAATGIAEGFSGSPVYCPSATGTPENIGAISEGVGQYGNNIGLVTPIEQMLGEPVLPPAGSPRLRARTRPLLGPLTATGLSPAVMAILERAGEKAGRLVAAAPASPTGSFPLQPLVPGASVSVSYSEGAIALGAVGTVTYRDGANVYAFGHELDGAGRRSLLLGDAYVYGVIDNPDPAIAPSYKLASPGNPQGTLTSDTPNGVIGTVGTGPALIPVDVQATDLDTGRVLTLDTQVADETDIGNPVGGSLLDLVAPIAVGQAATEIYDGAPAAESGRMCVEISLRESAAPLQLCRRYVGIGTPGDAASLPELAGAASSDLTTALGILDSVQFASLHVTRLAVQIEAERGLAQARIVSAAAPRRARAGSIAPVRIVVRRYRGSLATILVRVRIPRHAHGLLGVRIAGPASFGGGAGSAGLISQLAAALAGGGAPTPSGAGPASIAELRAQIAGIASYDGLSIRLGGRRAARLYRDPSLLILGSARLVLDVNR